MTSRTVIGSNGRPRRLVLLQPPHFRTGQTAPLPTPESAERDVTRAIRASQMAAVSKGRTSTSRTAR